MRNNCKNSYTFILNTFLYLLGQYISQQFRPLITVETSPNRQVRGPGRLMLRYPLGSREKSVFLISNAILGARDELHVLCAVFIRIFFYGNIAGRLLEALLLEAIRSVYSIPSVARPDVEPVGWKWSLVHWLLGPSVLNLFLLRQILQHRVIMMYLSFKHGVHVLVLRSTSKGLAHLPLHLLTSLLLRAQLSLASVPALVLLFRRCLHRTLALLQQTGRGLSYGLVLD